MCIGIRIHQQLLQQVTRQSTVRDTSREQFPSFIETMRCIALLNTCLAPGSVQAPAQKDSNTAIAGLRERKTESAAFMTGTGKP